MRIFRAILFLLVCVFVTEVNAQTSVNDTTQVYTKPFIGEKNQTERVDLLIAYAHYHIENKSLDSSKYYAREALKLAIDNGRKDVIQKAYWYIGRSYLYQFDFESTIRYMEKAEGVYEKEKDTTRLIKILNTKGLSMRSLGRFEESIYVFKSSLSLAEQIDDKRLIIINAINLGASYKVLKNNDQAVNYYSKALELAEETNDSLHLGIIVTNFGNIYSSLEQNDKARDYYERALTIHEKNKNYSDIGMIWANISHLDLKEGNYDSAIKNAKKTIEIADSTFVPIGAIIVANANLGEAYLGKKEFGSSRVYLDKAIKISLKNKVPAWLEEIYKYKAELEKETGNLSSAYEYLKKHIQIKDSILDTSLTHKINLEETQTELNQKEKEITLLEEDNVMVEKVNKSLKSWIVIGLLVILGLLSLIYIYYLRQKSESLALRKAAAENKLEALRNQMNPHFLFNSFNAVQHYILKSEKDNAYNYLTKVAFLIRKVLDNASSMTIDLEEELEILETYIKLEVLRFQDKFTYDLEISPFLLELNPRIPSMVIQPYIENAILHGLSNKDTGDGILKIQINELEENKIRCLIEDNGIGRDRALQIKESKAKHMRGNSIAMNNTSRRLQILEKAGYPHGDVTIEDLYDLENKPSGTRVILELSMI